MRFTPAAAVGLVTLLWGAGMAHAQETTSLTLGDMTVAYSHAVDATATLTRNSDGHAVEGADVSFSLRDSGSTFAVDLGHGLTGPDGRITVRIPMVNGCGFLGNVVLAAGPTGQGTPYVVEPVFAGDMLGGVAYAGSRTSAFLRLEKESVQVQLVSGASGTLGESLTIVGKIEDPSGDAPCDRSSLTGDRPTTLAGHRLAFFWDINGDHDYSDPREFLGTVTTARPSPQADAVGSITVDTSPVGNLPRAGTAQGALQIQLPADDTLYLPTNAVSELTLEAAPVDALKTTFEADPPMAQAGGSYPVTITITLRDRFNNPLGLDDLPHAVALKLEGNTRGAAMVGEQAERDPSSGKYTQTLQGASFKGVVSMRVTVDGQEGSTFDYTFTGLFPVGPCACHDIAHGHSVWLGGLVAGLGLLLRRRQS